MKRFLKKIIFLFCFIVTFPMSFLYKITRSRDFFAGSAQLMALIPGKIGSYFRVSYYCMTLKRCSSDSYIGFGSFFSHPEAELGDKCYIGAYTIIGMAKIGDHATIGSHVSILSGKSQHGYREIGRPVQQQPGVFTKIFIGKNCWIGNNAVVMANIGKQNVVASGSVVVLSTNDYEIVAGNPAKHVKNITD
ncbi:MAG: acyltransferase [Desulfobulbus sp.]|nr:acyltransferase [Desulfobulbus sp.]